MSDGRVRPYEIIFYGSLGELYKILRENSARIAHYAFIYHDRDVYEEDGENDENGELKHKKGDLKVPHFHVLVEFYHATLFGGVKRMFTTETDKPRIQAIVDRQAKFEYLTHKRYPEKYQYSESEIVSNDIEFYRRCCKNGDRRDTDNIAEQIVRDLVKGVPPWTMISRYGRDYIIHRDQYQFMALECQRWDYEHARDVQACAALIEDDDIEQLELPF